MCDHGQGMGQAEGLWVTRPGCAPCGCAVWACARRRTGARRRASLTYSSILDSASAALSPPTLTPSYSQLTQYFRPHDDHPATPLRLRRASRPEYTAAWHGARCSRAPRPPPLTSAVHREPLRAREESWSSHAHELMRRCTCMGGACSSMPDAMHVRRCMWVHMHGVCMLEHAIHMRGCTWVHMHGGCMLEHAIHMRRCT